MTCKTRNQFHVGASVCLLAGSLVAVAWAPHADAQDAPGPATRKVNYSPYPAQTFPNRVYFGDTHLHTSYSADAGMAGAIVGPEDAYRFARGEEVKSNSGLPVKLSRPLDFLVIADHAENLGLAPMIAESDPALLKSEWGKKVHDLAKTGTIEGQGAAFNMWIAAMQELKDPFKGQEETMARPAWKRTHGGRREIQRARALHRHHRLRVDLGAERRQPASQRVCSATARTRPTRSSRCPTTTPAIRRISGRGWRLTSRRPAARCWRSRTTATCRTA